MRIARPARTPINEYRHCSVSRGQLLTDHHSMPIWRPYDELSHAMRCIGRRLEYDGAPIG